MVLSLCFRVFHPLSLTTNWYLPFSPFLKEGTKVKPNYTCNLISTFLLLKNGYKWIQYVSFEHEIEKRKNEYYQALRSCQAQRPNEDVTVWIQFFLNCLSNIQSQLMAKLNRSGFETQFSPVVYSCCHRQHLATCHW